MLSPFEDIIAQSTQKVNAFLHHLIENNGYALLCDNRIRSHSNHQDRYKPGHLRPGRSS